MFLELGKQFTAVCALRVGDGTLIGSTPYTPPTFEMYKINRDSAMEAVLVYPR